ncbi:hypothetical protein CONPUDRAFT_54130, partial [Coniophora puteana RWD-64-598 SS2]
VILGYICIVFVLGSIGTAMGTKWCEMVFIDVPQGSNVLDSPPHSNIIWISNAVSIVNLWFQDGLLLYRFHIIWRQNMQIIFLPTITFLATIVLGCLLVAQTSEPLSSFPSGLTSHITIAYWSLSIAYTAVLTLGITARLLYMRWRIRAALASAYRTCNPYVSISAMLIESAALYTVIGLVFIIAFSMESEIQNLVLGLLGQTQSIAPLMIVYRVLQGRAWSTCTYQSLDISDCSLVVEERSPAGLSVQECGRNIMLQG